MIKIIKSKLIVPESANEANSLTFYRVCLMVLRDLMHNFRGFKLISLKQKHEEYIKEKSICVCFYRRESRF